MSLPFYQEINLTLDGQGDGTIKFQPSPAYGTASVTLQIVGSTSGSGKVLLGANPLALISISQPFGPFDVPPNVAVNVVITGGQVDTELTCVLQGACYLPSETVPAQNLQVGTITSGGTENWTQLFDITSIAGDQPDDIFTSDLYPVKEYASLALFFTVETPPPS